jgi:mRNA-degrading endonuclease toxin of MazEF toxin-antitoxin module
MTQALYDIMNLFRATIEAIVTIPTRLLVSRITSLSADNLHLIREAIRFSLDL